MAAVLTACSTSAPAMPSSTEPGAVHEFLTGSEAGSRLEAISTYDWPDNGAEPAAYFDWIAADATSADSTVATRAGESAHALAVFLGEEHSELESLPSDLAAAYGRALTPFQGALVGDDDGIRGFGQLGGPGDFSAERGIFSVIATNAEAGERFVESAYSRARAIAAGAAERVCRDGGAATAAVRQAAELSGLAASADSKRDERLQATDEVTHAMAVACVSVAKEPPQGRITDFIRNGVLMSPEAAGRIDLGLEGYFQSQRDYLAARGIELNGFSDAFDAAIGR
ncbi:hypothetical protein E4P42_06810 [Mycobacterium sp. PS03-16]|uniref:hypothetical protein n=1 Tax=Mycobacterium sp. PS03-16 TaxID=2559611 RepID=UPI001073BF3B|nr:hypothetical protein [Mycobacterium sp. PS03-16]TFV60073.1 hypothetical protein E4P42_06810 [Mycobacterium sp. PS03-16]